METNFKEELDKLVQQAKDLADDIHLKENLEKLRDGLVDLTVKTGQKIDELAQIGRASWRGRL